jgi:hypothetical protein
MTLIWPLTSQRMIKRPAFKCPIIRFLPSEFFPFYAIVAYASFLSARKKPSARHIPARCFILTINGLMLESSGDASFQMGRKRHGVRACFEQRGEWRTP